MSIWGFPISLMVIYVYDAVHVFTHQLCATPFRILFHYVKSKPLINRTSIIVILHLCHILTVSFGSFAVRSVLSAPFRNNPSPDRLARS
ncbi:hypothetical protein DER45DRAFT_20220 [Fusarium avenaceum]|nr:hypothetical protein DER45DRAFT_20220 [Fusarium avenaceum]